MPSSIPVVVCGKSPKIAASVKSGLAPAYEVIHVVYSSSTGKSEIPALLQGRGLNVSDDVGSGNFSKPPEAVITGAAYGDAEVDEMRKACEGLPKVPWLRPNLETPTPPVGPGYGDAMVNRVKACLEDLAKQGKFGEDGVHFF